MKKEKKNIPLKFCYFLIFGAFMLLLGSDSNFSVLTFPDNDDSSYSYIDHSHPALIETKNVSSLLDQPFHPNSSGSSINRENLYLSGQFLPDLNYCRFKALELTFLKIKPLLLERFVKSFNKELEEVLL